MNTPRIGGDLLVLFACVIVVRVCWPLLRAYGSEKGGRLGNGFP